MLQHSSIIKAQNSSDYETTQYADIDTQVSVTNRDISIFNNAQMLRSNNKSAGEIDTFYMSQI